MRVIQHPSNNGVLAPPHGTPLDICRPLPITRVEYPDGQQATMSFWTLTNEEIAHLINGATICVIFPGSSHPPMRMAIGTPVSK